MDWPQIWIGVLIATIIAALLERSDEGYFAKSRRCAGFFESIFFYCVGSAGRELRFAWVMFILVSLVLFLGWLSDV